MLGCLSRLDCSCSWPQPEGHSVPHDCQFDAKKRGKASRELCELPIILAPDARPLPHFRHLKAMTVAPDSADLFLIFSDAVFRLRIQRAAGRSEDNWTADAASFILPATQPWKLTMGVVIPVKLEPSSASALLCSTEASNGCFDMLVLRSQGLQTTVQVLCSAIQGTCDALSLSTVELLPNEQRVTGISTFLHRRNECTLSDTCVLQSN